MIIVNHRVNTIKDLKKIPFNHGIEIDVRYHENQLILNHDPFNHHISKNTKLSELLEKCKFAGPIILNLKSAGIEEKCINIMKEYKLNNWFFLDMSLPLLVKYSDKAYNNKSTIFSKDNFAVRFSDKEPIEYVLLFKDKVRWVWVDYFSDFPLTLKNLLLLKNANFKICLVSPEIQPNSIFTPDQVKEKCSGFEIDAVCTKNPRIWIKN